MDIITINKRFENLPFAHRQPRHQGHCALIHGHNWSFDFQFSATTLDENGFVLDFGDLGWLRTWLEDRFDHTLVLNEDDPYLGYLSDVMEDSKNRPLLANIVVVPNCGAEGLARYIRSAIATELYTRYGGRVLLTSVTVFEDTKNTAAATL